MFNLEIETFCLLYFYTNTNELLHLITKTMNLEIIS